MDINIFTVKLREPIDGSLLESILLETAKQLRFTVDRETFSKDHSNHGSVSYVYDFGGGSGPMYIDGSSRISLGKKFLFLPLEPFAHIFYTNKGPQDSFLAFGDDMNPDLARYFLKLNYCKGLSWSLSTWPPDIRSR
jgi:hypothetical protein